MKLRIVMKCANCNCNIKNDSHRNVDGEPCCTACWLAEEDKLKNY